MPKRKMNESFRFSADRFGFLGQGFGKPNTFDPYNSIKESEENAGPDVEATEDAWAGGENLTQPQDYVKTYHKLDTVREPETLDLVMTESKLRSLIRHVLKAGTK